MKVGKAKQFLTLKDECDQAFARNVAWHAKMASTAIKLLPILSTETLIIMWQHTISIFYSLEIMVELSYSS